jgi:hypothetical protein
MPGHFIRSNTMKMKYFDAELDACLFALAHHGTMIETTNGRFKVMFN